MTQTAHIAIDLGAESGRVIVGLLNQHKLTCEEVHRFRHLPIPTPGGMCWNITGLWQSILEGLAKANTWARERHITLHSVGVDTWGVDWTLVSPANTMLGLPRCYRDPAFASTFKRAHDKLGAAAIYEATGIQHMPLNTLYQYVTRFEEQPELFGNNARLMFMPDLLHWLLSGQVTTERTNASTSQMLDVRTGTWNTQLLNSLEVTDEPLGPIIDAGTPIGSLRPEVARTTGLDQAIKVIAPPTHDTASAVAAVPAEPDTRWAYLSSGTWSLLGAELDTPCINERSASYPFTNELGVANTVRFLKNIGGLWLVQEVRRQREREGKNLDYAQLTEQAAGSEPLRALIPVNDPLFAQPGHMIDKVRAYAAQTHQKAPESIGQVVRCCLESLALEYRRTLRNLEHVLNREFDILHVVGGGGRNGLLNRMTVHATGKSVVVGPEEATAMGNLLTQAMGMNALTSLEEMRQVVRESVELQRIEPDPAAREPWDAAAERYETLPPADPANAA